MDGGEMGGEMGMVLYGESTILLSCDISIFFFKKLEVVVTRQLISSVGKCTVWVCFDW